MIPMPTRSSTLIFFLTALIALNAGAQTLTFTATRAEMDCSAAGSPVIRVLLDGSLKTYLDDLRYEDGLDCRGTTPDDKCKKYKAVKKVLENALAHSSYSKAFYMLEVKSGSKTSLVNNFTTTKILYDEPPQLTLDFTAAPGLTIAHDDSFVVMANVSKLDDGAVKPNPHIVNVSITPSCQRVPADLPKAPTNDAPEPKDVTDFLVDSSKAKDANIGVSFALNGSKGHRIYSHDIAIQIGRLHRLGLGGAYDIIPFFLQHKFTRDEKSPKDDLKFGFKANHLFLFDRYSRRSRDGSPERDLFNSLQTTLSAHIESDFLFSDQVNFVGSWRTGLPLNLFDERSSAARITPFIGYETGYVIKDESPTTKNKLLSRGLFGVDIFVAPWRKEKTNPFEIELSYIRRVLAREEAQYYVNADGKEVFGGFNRSPKNFVKARLTFNYNDTFSPFFQYSYGREPGRYVLQNSVMEAGLKVYLKWEQ